MPNPKDMMAAITHPNETFELQNGLKAIEPVLKDPSIPRQEKRKTLNQMVENLSDKTFEQGYVANIIIRMINMKEEICKQFKNTDAQVVEILSTMPRMAKHRDKLNDTVKSYRKQYKLTV